MTRKPVEKKHMMTIGMRDNGFARIYIDDQKIVIGEYNEWWPPTHVQLAREIAARLGVKVVERKEAK